MLNLFGEMFDKLTGPILFVAPDAGASSLTAVSDPTDFESGMMFLFVDAYMVPLIFFCMRKLITSFSCSVLGCATFIRLAT